MRTSRPSYGSAEASAARRFAFGKTAQRARVDEERRHGRVALQDFDVVRGGHLQLRAPELLVDVGVPHGDLVARLQRERERVVRRVHEDAGPRSGRVLAVEADLGDEGHDAGHVDEGVVPRRRPAVHEVGAGERRVLDRRDRVDLASAPA